MIKQKSILKPLIELLIAAVLWGFGFVATVWALKFLNPAAIMAYRFLGAAFIGGLLFPFMRFSIRQFKFEFKLASIAGLTLGLCLFLQTWGLQYTTATNSGFITTLYAVFVPFLARVFFKEKLTLVHWVCVLIAILGTALIVNLQSLQMNFGDLLTLLCAIVAAGQIVYLGTVAKKTQNSFLFNMCQSFWAGMPFLLFAIQSQAQWDLSLLDQKAWLGLGTLTIGSTLIAFYLQVRAQKELNSSLASLLFLLESPFACLFGVIFLQETLSTKQLIGAVMILLSCSLATLAEHRTQRS